MNKPLLMSSVAAFAVAYGAATLPALAQQDAPEQPEAQQEAEDAQVARECLDELQATAEALAQEGYWVTGWGQRWGWGGLGQPGMAAHPDDVPPPTTGAIPEDEAATPEAPAAPAAPATGGDPWGLGPMQGMASPRHQIGALFSAANVLAYQGDQEGCQYVLARLQTTAESHLEELREMGVQPDEVVDWRREAMAGAVPLPQLETAGIQLDDLTGTDVRNPQDEYLGSVSDIVLDAEDGTPEYVVVARGGFLGIGEDNILVPWQDLAAAPQLNTLILDISEAEFEQAPAIDSDLAGDPEWIQEHRRQTQEYWEHHREG